MTLPPVAAETARDRLLELMSAWLQALSQPLPLAPRTGFTWLMHSQADQPEKAEAEARLAYEGGYQAVGERDRSAALGRLFPDFDSLQSDGSFDEWVQRLYLPLWQNVKQGEQKEGADD